MQKDLSNRCKTKDSLSHFSAIAVLASDVASDPLFFLLVAHHEGTIGYRKRVPPGAPPTAA